MKKIHSKLYAAIAAVGVTGLLVACNNNNTTTTQTPDSLMSAALEFVGITSPISTDANATKTFSSSSVKINGVDTPISYQELIRTGYADNGEIYGALKNIKGELLKEADGSTLLCNGSQSAVGGSGTDHTALIKKGSRIFMISQMECGIGAMYKAEVAQDASTGKLSLVPNTLSFIDQAGFHGGWVHCSGSTSPWNSFLGSEEYPTDADKVEQGKATSSSDPYWAQYSSKYFAAATDANPYFIGWIPEVTLDDSGKATYVKHFTLGRGSHEMAFAMPDKKTTYLSEDGANQGFYMFVADKTSDLSAGTLYAAKWTQTSATAGGTATLSWVSLGHAADSDIKPYVDSMPKFSSIFTKTAVNADKTCPATFTSVNTEVGQECLKVNDINKDGIVDAKDEVIASRLEKRRMAALKGATTEFNKFEGMTYNVTSNLLHFTISDEAKGMTDGDATYDIGGNNHVKLPKNVCGGVYQMALGTDSTIGSNYVGQSVAATIMGKPMAADANGNTCDLTSVGNPDNVSYIAKTNTLLIGEDGQSHMNDYVWAFNINTSTLTKIASTPVGAEATSAYWTELGNFGYINHVSQHPYGEIDTSAQWVKDLAAKATTADRQSTFGVIGPFPIK